MLQFTSIYENKMRDYTEIDTNVRVGSVYVLNDGIVDVFKRVQNFKIFDSSLYISHVFLITRITKSIESFLNSGSYDID